MKLSNSLYVKAAAAAVVLAAAVTAPMAQAASNVYFSIGAQVAPGVSVGVSNAPAYYPQQVYAQPVYAPPVYLQPRPYYVQPAQVYVRPAPVYVRPAPVYVQAPPVYVQAPPVYGVGYYYGPPTYYRQRIVGPQWRHRHWN